MFRWTRLNIIIVGTNVKRLIFRDFRGQHMCRNIFNVIERLNLFVDNVMTESTLYENGRLYEVDNVVIIELMIGFLRARC